MAADRKLEGGEGEDLGANNTRGLEPLGLFPLNRTPSEASLGHWGSRLGGTSSPRQFGDGL